MTIENLDKLIIKWEQSKAWHSRKSESVSSSRAYRLEHSHYARVIDSFLIDLKKLKDDE
jgi:hypothetical protein